MTFNTQTQSIYPISLNTRKNEIEKITLTKCRQDSLCYNPYSHVADDSKQFHNTL